MFYSIENRHLMCLNMKDIDNMNTTIAIISIISVIYPFLLANTSEYSSSLVSKDGQNYTANILSTKQEQSTINQGNIRILHSILLNGSPTATAINPVTNKIYVTTKMNESITALSIINGNNDQLESNKILLSGSVSGIAVNSITNKIFVAGEGKVYIIDGKIDRLESNIPIPYKKLDKSRTVTGTTT